PEIFTLSLHDALPILASWSSYLHDFRRFKLFYQIVLVVSPGIANDPRALYVIIGTAMHVAVHPQGDVLVTNHIIKLIAVGKTKGDRKSTRLNSSHVKI